MVHEAKPNAPRNIILFHDAGGDRSQTVEALPILIEKLKSQGYRFVPVSSLIGFSRDQAMPPLPPTMSLLTDRVVFYALSRLGRLLHFCFLAAIWLGIGRVLFGATAVTAGARWLAFVSPSTNLHPPNANNLIHTYLRGPLY
jgi:hypothetical protein